MWNNHGRQERGMVEGREGRSEEEREGWRKRGKVVKRKEGRERGRKEKRGTMELYSEAIFKEGKGQ